MAKHIAASASAVDVKVAAIAFAADTDDRIEVVIPEALKANAPHWTEVVDFVMPPTARFAWIHGAGDGSDGAPDGGGDKTYIYDDRTENDTPILIGTPNSTGGILRVFGLTFHQTNRVRGLGSLNMSGHYNDWNTPQRFRVDHCTFISFLRGLGFGGRVIGVADHNVFDVQAGVGAFFNSWSDAHGDIAWTEDSAFGTENFPYLEDNVFKVGTRAMAEGGGGTGGVNDSYRGSRFAIRFNDIDRAEMQTHPTGGSNRGRGTRAFESYGNLSRNRGPNPTVKQHCFFFLSAGTGLIHHNDVEGTDNFITGHVNRRDGNPYPQAPTPDGWGYAGTTKTGTGSNWDGNQDPTTGYPCLDQIGRGKGDLLVGEFGEGMINQATGKNYKDPGAYPRQRLEPVYVFGNVYNGNLWTDSNQGGAVLQNRDYYLDADPARLGKGLALPTAAGLTNDGFVKLDGGNWLKKTPGHGVTTIPNFMLFVRDASGVWKPYYQPLEYPHPFIVLTKLDTGPIVIPPPPTPIPPAPTPSEHLAASNNSIDVQAAMTAATEDGAIVTIPGGTVHWDDHVEWDVPPNAVLRSLSPLRITDDYKSNRSLISLNTHKDGSFRMYGIEVFGGSAGENPKYEGVVAIGGFSKDVRFYNCRVNVQTYAPVLQSCCLQFTGYVNGCVDHNVFDLHSVGNGIRVFMPWYGGTMDDGSASWATPTRFGGRDAIYVERNVFNGNSRFSCINDSGSGGRMVIRRNKINRAFIQTHPTRTGITRGARSMEIYLNEMEADELNPHSEGFFHDAGPALVWGNKAKGYKTFHLMRAPRRAPDPQHAEAPPPNGWGYAGTSFNGVGSNWDGNEDLVTGYPNLDQPGRGQGDLITGEFPNKVNAATGCDASHPCANPRQALEPVYSFLNDWTPVPNNPGGLIETADVIVEGRDYHKAKDGTRAQMDALTDAKEGEGFWVTDEGKWNTGADPELPVTVQGRLYARRNNAWVPIYEPLQYPHPSLTDDVGGVSLPPEPLPVPVPVPAPTPVPPNWPPTVRFVKPTGTGAIYELIVEGKLISTKWQYIKLEADDDLGPVTLEIWIDNSLLVRNSNGEKTLTAKWNTNPHKNRDPLITGKVKDADEKTAEVAARVKVRH